MKSLKLDLQYVAEFLPKEQIDNAVAEANACNQLLHNGQGKGNDFLGWVGLPQSISQKELDRINLIAHNLKEVSETIVVVGIGGSYLGARAVIEALSPAFERSGPDIIYAGHNVSQEYHAELFAYLEKRSFSIIVISKSGTTTEPAVAFRFLKEILERKFGVDEARKRIVAITDSKKGALKTLSIKEGYETFDIPDDVGGRYSVLTPVGLLPIACAGIDVGKLVKGAIDMAEQTSDKITNMENPALVYAAVRNLLYRKGCGIEIMASYNPKLYYLTEWWKQLYGESEGKEHKGIFPAGCSFTTDLHSLGQYIQDGVRSLFETIIHIESPKGNVIITSNIDDSDGLNYLAGRRLEEVNKNAELGTIMAHVEGGVPNIRIIIPELSDYSLGALLYFFEKACGISGYMTGVNPFDQPGVEAYKKNMFQLLGKNTN